MLMASSKKKKVCVVGAGVSGLASARELLREGHDVTVMEQSGDVGGQWLYDTRVDAGDPLGAAGVHSSMYSSVRLFTPRQVTGFSGFPFYPSSSGAGDARRYPCHGEFLRYIRDFCHAFGLMDTIRLNTKVLRVGVAPLCSDDDGTMRWTVRFAVKQGEAGGEVVTTEEEVFDAVVVAVGQYTQPRLPTTIDGMDMWTRRQLHSHSYRVPDSFSGEAVVVVGFHKSGKDIALELCEVASEVHVSVKSMDHDVTPGVSMALSRHNNMQAPPPDRSPLRGRPSGVRRRLVRRRRRHHLLHRLRLLLPVPRHRRSGDRRRQPGGPAVRPHLPAGDGAVAVVRGHTQQGGGAAVLRGAGEVGGAGAVRAEVAAGAGGDDARRRGVQPCKGDRRRAQAASTRRLGP